ncbi:hypothetical protein [Selenomonas ruminantium]|uniref:Uncharacterized protein n=1 Tax=Selenomonas ruminantium TaxID=971 RepID=A0A1K1P2C9_SELRU|nr:hypothetical protein [Selenomonas ruminantium]SFW41635.1 hypothetical protein SAMN02910323_1728 [Selenomonas ruminantium]
MASRIESITKKYMVFFLILAVSAASYCGFFSIWAFRDGASSMGFTAMIEGTAARPYVYRQLLPHVVKSVSEAIPQPARDKLELKLSKGKYIEARYSQAKIPQQYIIEYYLLYTFCFFAFFASIWVLRSLLYELVKDKVAGTLGAMLFALIFPFFEVLGGYYYDIFEFLFMFMAARFALHGSWGKLLILVPIATFNKESFLFFLITLYPLIRNKVEIKKAVMITLGTVVFAGLTYLYVRQLYAGNPGGMVEWWLGEHIKGLVSIDSYFYTTSIYGLPLGEGMFLPHIICIYLIVKKAWHHLTPFWKEHVKIAALINGILYFMFAHPNELRNLSLLYVSFMILTAFFIRDILHETK